MEAGSQLKSTQPPLPRQHRPHHPQRPLQPQSQRLPHLPPPLQVGATSLVMEKIRRLEPCLILPQEDRQTPQRVARLLVLLWVIPLPLSNIVLNASVEVRRTFNEFLAI